MFSFRHTVRSLGVRCLIESEVEFLTSFATSLQIHSDVESSGSSISLTIVYKRQDSLIP